MPAQPDSFRRASVGRSGWHAVVVAFLSLALLLGGCDFLARLVPGSPTYAPVGTDAAARTLPPTTEADPAALRTELLADGWRPIGVRAADLVIFFPPGWRVTLASDSTLGDFGDLSAGDPKRQEVEQTLEASDLFVLYAQDADYASGGDHTVILHLTGWATPGSSTVQELVGFLIRDRMDEATTWHEVASVTTGVGTGMRLHYWHTGAGDVAYSTVEVVFKAPNGEPYTLSMLAEESVTDRTWDVFTKMLGSMGSLEAGAS